MKGNYGGRSNILTGKRRSYWAAIGKMVKMWIREMRIFMSFNRVV